MPCNCGEMQCEEATDIESVAGESATVECSASSSRATPMITEMREPWHYTDSEDSGSDDSVGDEEGLDQHGLHFLPDG